MLKDNILSLKNNRVFKINIVFESETSKNANPWHFSH